MSGLGKLGLSLLASTFLAGPAFAQTAPATPTTGTAQAEAGDSASSDIIVTAQRKSEQLSRTPVAVSVVSGDQLSAARILTEVDLTAAVPGLSVQSGASSNQINFVVRGQATDPYSNTRPGVITYFDEIPVVAGGGSTAFFDLDSVQVLKGPQGTLFGRNSVGGAVLFTTAKPKDKFEGYASASVGNYNSFRFEGAINAPIVSGVAAARVAGFYEKRDGFQYNLLNGKRLGSRDRFGIRGSLKLTPSANFENDLVVDYFHADETSLSNVLFNVQPGFAAPAPVGLLFSPFLDVITSFPGAFAAVAAANPGASPGGISQDLINQQNRGPYQVTSRSGLNYVAKNLTISNVSSLELADNLTLKNIFGYGHFDQQAPYDPFGSPYIIDNVLGQFINEQLSDEVQFVGRSGDLSYTAGAFASVERFSSVQDIKILDISPIIPVSPQINSYHTRNRTLAGYAQGTYNLSNVTGINGLAITLGARYTSEQVRSVLNPEDVNYPGAVIDPTQKISQQKTINNVSWTARLEDQVSNSLLLYAVTRRSFRNGGYNGNAAPRVGLGNTGGNGFATEQATDAELGLKWKGNIAGHIATFNFAAYQTWLENNQRTVFTVVGATPAAITVNVPKARVRGLEADTSIKPTSWLQIGGAVNFTDGKFTDNQVSVLGQPPVPYTTYPYASKFSGNAFATATIPLSADLDLALNGDVYRQSSFYFGTTGSITPNVRLPGYTIANFRVTLADDRKGWSLSGTVRNAFDRVYYVGGLNVVQLFQLASVLPGDPRTFAVEAKYKF